ncbi:MAG: sugar phosphate permease [Halieaceae bacterium]|jgi:sugar phosphate permease
MSEATGPSAAPTAKRYAQLAVLTIAGGGVYPLIYLRQNFEVSILESFGITLTELGQCYAMLGIIFVLTYVPSGWLADRISPRWLVSFSLALTGILGLWFATMPGFDTLKIIFAGWGIATGLTFWAALIKGVSVLARHNEQGRFFGILDGGRGLVEAILATIAVAWFSHSLTTLGLSTEAALQKVIYMYVGFALVLSPIVWFAIDDINTEDAAAEKDSAGPGQWGSVKRLLKTEEVWLVAFCILSGYQLFWATYSFSGYLQTHFGMTAVTVGTITVAKLWMRPIGAISAGFVGDHFNLENTLGWLLLAASISLMGMIVLPVTAGVGLMLVVVLTIGFLTYAVRGIFWGTLDSCGIPIQIKGLAIGLISLVGYAPDVYLPLINGPLLEAYPGRLGYGIYFSGLVIMGFMGAAAAWRLKHLVVRRALVTGE